MTPMRIAVLTWGSRRVGGAETYLGTIVPAFRRHGHEVLFFHEVEGPADRERLAFDAGVPFISVEAKGPDAALAQLKAWRPDVLYTHGLLEPALEARTFDIAPAVFFAHAYYGACISGTKAFSAPVREPCGKPFGPACLLHFYPRRCGGLSPVTMVTDYRRQRKRFELLKNYRAILTHSVHMQREYERYPGLMGRVQTSFYALGVSDLLAPFDDVSRPAPRLDRTIRLVFASRIDPLKGGDVLLEALPLVAASLGRPVRLDVAGDGPRHANLRTLADELTRRHPAVNVTFHGWCGEAALRELFDSVDLLVVPSLWPEPYGLVGIEAGSRGLPAAGFDVGGITDWLKDGINGCVAPGNPPTAQGLAGAIARCVENDARLSKLRTGARAMARALDDPERHVALVLDVLVAAARSPEAQAR